MRGDFGEARGATDLEQGLVPGGAGILPQRGRVQEAVRDLLITVKRYERLTVEAALTGEVHLARQALAANPLVPDQSTADRLVEALRLT